MNGTGAVGRTWRIGLTGPIGCGKSTISGMLADRGAVVIDADEVARVVTAPGQPAHDEILAAFGEAVRTAEGTVDRAALAWIAFSDPVALTTLERIVHPRVRPVILRAIEEATAAGAPAVVVEAIKLVESGLADACDQVWLVDCAPEDQRARLGARGMRRSDVERRIEIQGNLRDRLSTRASRRIDTSKPRERVEADVDRIWTRLREEAPAR